MLFLGVVLTVFSVFSSIELPIVIHVTDAQHLQYLIFEYSFLDLYVTLFISMDFFFWISQMK